MCGGTDLIIQFLLGPAELLCRPQIVGILGSEGVQLILRVRAHPGIGSHPELSGLFWGVGRDHHNAGTF